MQVSLLVFETGMRMGIKLVGFQWNPARPMSSLHESLGIQRVPSYRVKYICFFLCYPLESDKTCNRAHSIYDCNRLGNSGHSRTHYTTTVRYPACTHARNIAQYWNSAEETSRDFGTPYNESIIISRYSQRGTCSTPLI
jgi:hypothetical protein